ncbi:MAG: hypothetical protein EVA73_02260 [Limisphaerales bacterium]|nr:MAG: hypothetical protein EVA73_02260 [Limisphaerales bacterium]
MSEPGSSESPQWGWWVAVVFGLQAVFLWWVSSGEPDAGERNEASLVQVDLALVEALAMEEPMSLGQPRTNGFSAVWLKPTPLQHEFARWTPPEIPLPPESNVVETIILEALEKNPVPEFRSFEKPVPKLTRISVPPLRQEERSRLVLRGGLAERTLVGAVDLKAAWKHDSFLRPTRVQVVVDSMGRVMNGVLLAESGHAPADAVAMELALKKIRFNAAANSTAYASGELVFQWHTDSASVTNVTERFPR